MKTNFVKLAVVAAVAMIAPVAGAQTFAGRMTAEVPFAFQAGKAALPAGTYFFTMNASPGGTPIVHVGNTTTGEAAHFTVPGSYRKAAPNTQANAVFSCKAGSCLLIALRVHDNEYGTGMTHKTAPAAPERVYTVHLSPHKGRSAE
ncbi:MAG: hypothetical protein JNK48_17585 [Bryobacterales bacterium]|nr:hypothetical protein [Bryobacterales bacterium]